MSMIKKVIKIIKLFFGSSLVLLGIFLIIYDIYWLMTRGNNYSGDILSGLGKGFAMVNILMGIVFLLVGVFLLKLKKKTTA
ncbi:MAG: hypothetical protein QW559_02615 [Candidatus Woesearchaeota archaeon]